MITIEEIFEYDRIGNTQVFNKLLSRCKNGYAVPYIGAGMSMFVGLPSWMQFLNQLKEQCHDKNFSLDNPLEAADEIEKQLGSAVFQDCLKKVFHHEESDAWWSELLEKHNVSNQAISIIPKLFYGPIITSNYDKVIESVHNQKIDIALPDEIEKLENTNDEVKHLLYKVHGCVSQPEKIVFTGKSYKNYYDSGSSHVKILSKFFKRFNLLFLGCSLNLNNKDKPIELWETLVSSGQQHFAILPCAKNSQKKRRKELEHINIYPIFYPEGRHECIKIILEELLIEKVNDSIKVPIYDNEKYPFVGRNTILDDIKARLYCKKNNILYLSGIGGVGKTRIACEYARLNRNEYTSGTYFFHAVSEDILFAEIIQFAQSKKLDIDSNQSQVVVYDKVAEWMNNNNNWLFVLDNMEDCNHINKLIRLVQNARLPNARKHFLITTRRNENIENYIFVDTFSKEESNNYLYNITKEMPNEYSCQLGESLGWLPLALEQAATYIVKEKIDYKEYYRLLNKKGLLETLKKGEYTDNTLAVNATFNLSIEKLNCEELRQLLYLCSYFASENIELEWIRSSYKHLQKYPNLCKLVNDTDSLQKMAEELSSYSLIREDDGKITIHRLTQTVIRKMLENDNEWVEICSKTMAEVFDLKNFDRPDSKPTFLEMVPHMEQLFSFYINSPQKGYTISLGQLYHIYMFGFDKIKEHDIALKYLDRTLKIRKKMSNKRDYAKTLNLAGVVFQNKGDYKKAISFFTKAVKLRKEVFSESGEKNDESLLARTYNNIALNYYWIGKYDKSKSFHQLAINIKDKYDDLDDRAFSYNNIGALFEAMSKHDNYLAMAYHQKAFDIRINMENIVNLAFTLNNMGVIEKNLGNYADALLYLDKALELRKKVYGANTLHPEIAQTCTNIADIYINTGKKEDAKQMLDIAIKIYEVKLTNKHIETSKAYFNLAKWFYVQSLYEDALYWFKKVMEIRKTKLSGNDANSEINELERMIKKCEIQAKGESLLNGIE